MSRIPVQATQIIPGSLNIRTSNMAQIFGLSLY